MNQTNFVSRFWIGITAPIRAIRMIMTTPSILALVMVPLAINIGLYILFFYHGAHFLGDSIGAWNTRFVNAHPNWIPIVATLLSGLLKLLGWLLLLLVAAMSFTLIGSVVCSPFNDLLSRQTAKILLNRQAGGLPDSNIQKELEGGLGQTIRLELKRAVILLLGGTCAFIIGLIPFLQPVALGIGAILISFEYFGYPLSRRTPRLRPVWAFTIGQFWASAGMGTFFLLLMILPFVSIVFIPLAVVTGTLLHHELSE